SSDLRSLPCLDRHRSKDLPRDLDGRSVTNSRKEHGGADVSPGGWRIERQRRARLERAVSALTVLVEINEQAPVPLQERGALGRVVAGERRRGIDRPGIGSEE